MKLSSKYPSRSRRGPWFVVLIALVLALAYYAFRSWGGGGKGPWQRQLAPTSLSSAEVESSTSLPDPSAGRLLRSKATVSLQGKIEWRDGTPASGTVITFAVVGGAAESSKCDNGGVFLLADLMSSAELPLNSPWMVRVHAPCWNRARILSADPPELRDGKLVFPTITLPDEFDIIIRLDCGRGLGERLQRAGFNSCAVRLKEAPAEGSDPATRLRHALSPPLAIVNLQRTFDGPTDSVQTLPLLRQVQADFFLEGDIEDGKLEIATRSVQVDRSRLVRIDLEIDSRDVLSGVVVDQQQMPVPQAELEVRDTSPGDPLRFRDRRAALNARGEFLLFGQRGDITSIRARFDSRHQATLDHVPIGSNDIVICLDLSGLSPVRVHRGGVPIQRYRLPAPGDSFMAASMERAVPLYEHAKGLGWWPQHKGNDIDSVFLLWEENGQRYTELVYHPKQKNGQLLEIDVDHVSAVPNGSIELSVDRNVLWGRHPSAIFRRIRPASSVEHGPGVYLVLGLDDSGRATAKGIPPGRYEIVIGSSFDSGQAEPLRMECDFGGGRLSISYP